MDSVGAMLGPLVAFGILLVAPARFDAVFVVSFCIAAMGLVVLLAFVRDRRDRVTAGVDVSLRAGVALLRQREFRTATVQATVLAAVTLSDAFVYLLLQHRLDVALVWFPLLPLGTSSVYMLLAAPVGRLADRWGRRRVFVAGNAAMLAVYVVLLAPLPAAAVLVLALALHGVYYAATNGVLMALVTPSLPTPLRTSGMAIVQSGTAAASFVSSVAAGVLWSSRGPTFTLAVFVVGLTLALVGTRGGRGPSSGDGDRERLMACLRGRLAAVGAALAVLLAMAVGYVAHASTRGTQPAGHVSGGPAPVTAAGDVGAVTSTGPFYAFKSSRLDGDFGRVAVAPASDPTRRVFTRDLRSTGWQ